LLAELGFGLDLEQCAATGGTSELVYVSPKSGRAVSRVAGEPWRERMLRLPAFLSDDWDAAAPVPEHLVDAFRLTGFFLERYVFLPRGLAIHDARASFIAAALRDADAARAAS
jgi:DNA repair protein RecO (recombination protein O)